MSISQKLENGYKNQIGELVIEMELPAMLLNFGIIGFILYFGPFVIIIGYYFLYAIKNRKSIKIDIIMNLLGLLLAIGLSCFSGYVFFNISSMTMVIILCTRLQEKSLKIICKIDQKDKKDLFSFGREEKNKWTRNL